MNILSIQSEVVYGHVGQGAARPALQCLGHEVWAIPSVILSGHAGRQIVTGEAVRADLMARLLDGVVRAGWLARCDAVLSGYLGSADQADVVAAAVRAARAANRHAVYCLDPVFGDEGRAYAKHGVAEAMARLLLPLADIVTPNAFELSSLASMPVRAPDEAIAAARRLARPLVLATSVPDGARIGTLAVTPGQAVYATTPCLDGVPHGAGDLLAALFLAQRLEGADLKDALAGAVGPVYALLCQSLKDGLDEMPLVTARSLLNGPTPADLVVSGL
ncbi:MAG: pyridoxal kinase [Alphaproteobacteria bacterium]|nr:pyridoxal kinase [Alphaproteobacteria bacterium]